jgi:hypothetical protein
LGTIEDIELVKSSFKQFDLENYVCADVNKKSISTFVKIRISNSNLNIEKGRYLNTPAEDRICTKYKFKFVKVRHIDK